MRCHERACSGGGGGRCAYCCVLCVCEAGGGGRSVCEVPHTHTSAAHMPKPSARALAMRRHHSRCSALSAAMCRSNTGGHGGGAGVKPCCTEVPSSRVLLGDT